MSALLGRYRRVMVGSAAVVALLGAGVGVANASSSGVSPRTHDVIRRNLTQIPLSPSGAVRVTVEAVTLPAGQWVLSSKESVVNFGPSDYVRCGLVGGSSDINWATSVVGDPSQSGSVGAGTLVATLTEFGSVSSKQPIDVSVQCDHDTSTPAGAASPYVDADSALWAHKSTFIDNMGES
jgi:hypothetical protein